MPKNITNGVFNFNWTVSKGGYCWAWALVETQDGRELPLTVLRDDDPLLQTAYATFRRVLVPCSDVAVKPGAAKYRAYNPLDDCPGIHRSLSAVEPTEQAILQFANTYGPLGLYRQDVDVTNYGTSDLLFFPADSLEDWKREISDLAIVVHSWDRVRKGREANPLALEKIAERVRPRLVDVQGIPRVRPDGRGLHMEIVPKNLCTALWLQFTRETDGNSELARCRECGQWFWYVPEKIKTPRVFCSQACRSKAYRDRQQQARARYSQGSTVQEIAETLGSTELTVRKWIEMK